MSREDQLGRRVRWLDRHRRTIAIIAAVAFAPFCLVMLPRWLGSEWPEAHVWMLSTLASVMTWWVVEVALAWQAALWETEYDQLRHDRGLPPARVVRRGLWLK